MTSSTTRKKRPKIPRPSPVSASEAIDRLIDLQRKRAILIKSRVMQTNRLKAIVAGTLGYTSDMEEKDRKKIFREADKVIAAVITHKGTHCYDRIIHATMAGVLALKEEQKVNDVRAEAYAKMLPIAPWIEEPEQRGFGFPSLAVVVGECGDLANYVNYPKDDERRGKRGGVARLGGVGKLWRRMGCTPFHSNRLGITRMGRSWRTEAKDKLEKEEWTEYGYCPRRRSLMWNIGEALLKQNQLPKKNAGETRGDNTNIFAGDPMSEDVFSHVGTILLGEETALEDPEGADDDEKDLAELLRVALPYRRHYLLKKEEAKKMHTDWTDGHCNNHAKLLMVKLLLKNLWIAWNCPDRRR